MSDTKENVAVAVEMTEIGEKDKKTDKKSDVRYDPEARARAGNMTNYVSMICNITLTIIKYVVGVFGHSSALIADAIHSLSDLISDFVATLVLCMAKKPADVDHPYGHGRMEVIGSVFVALMLFVAACIVGYESIDKLIHPITQELEWYTCIAAFVSIVVKEALFWYAYLVGKKIDSPVVIANAWHHRSDALSSIVALIGIFVGLLGFNKADPIAGLIVAFMIAYIGINIMYTSLCALSDRIPNQLVDKLNTILLDVPGVEGFSDIRAREMGAFILVDLRLYVHPGTHVEDAEEIQDVVEKQIKEAIPNVSEVMIRITSIQGDDKHCNNVDNIQTRIRTAVMAVKGVKEISQIRVFGPEPYSVDIHIHCDEFESFCEQHQTLHEVRRVIFGIDSMKAVHVGLECDDDHEVVCTESDKPANTKVEKAEEASTESVPITENPTETKSEETASVNISSFL